jgi:hypothetical protein
MTEAIDAVSTQLAALEESITGITKAFAFDEMPDALSTAFLPCFTNIPNGAEYVDVSAQYGTGIVAEVRQYEATCWYKPVQAPPDMARHAAGTNRGDQGLFPEPSTTRRVALLYPRAPPE